MLKKSTVSTVEVAFDLEETVGVSLTPIAVNKIDAVPPVLNADSLESTLRSAYLYAVARSNAQSAALEFLSDALPLQQLRIPRFTSTGEQLINELANTFEMQLRVMQ